MGEIQISEEFLAKAAGWQAMKEARALLATGRVLSSNWTPPVLKGVVQAGEVSLRSGLVIKSTVDIENICSCRSSREWGTICAHSVAVGLHHLARPNLPKATSQTAAVKGSDTVSAQAPTGAVAKPRELRRARAGEVGEPLALHVILPHNLDQALARGKVMVFVEAAMGRERMPLNAVAKQRVYALDASDARLLDEIERLADGKAAGMLMLSAADFVAVLASLKHHPRITLGKSASVQVEDKPWAPPLRATLQPDGEIVLGPGGAESERALVVEGWAWRSNTFRPLALSAAWASALKVPVRVPRTQVPQFLGKDWAELQASGAVEANFRLEDFQLDPQPPRFVLNLAGGLAQLNGQLQCRYAARVLTLGVSSAAEVFWFPDPTSPTRYSTRDLSAEQGAMSRLLRAGFSGPDHQGRYQMLGQERVLSFFAREYPRLQREWEVTLEERLAKSTSQNLERIEPKFTITPSGVRWFDLEVSFGSPSGERFSAAEMQRLVRAGQNYQRLKNGRVALIDTTLVEEFNQVLQDCAPQQQEGVYRIDQRQSGFLASSVRQNGWQLQAPAEWKDRAGRAGTEATAACPPLGDLEGVLRPYQKTGVGWMTFLRANDFGGILADEMGLGKTLQALAYLEASRSRTQERLPSLVVCPTSLVFNWLSEAQRFTPTLSLLALDGPRRRERFGEIPSRDLVVTSYALLRRDADVYRSLEFDTVILDEAQHIKNRQTQNAQAVKNLRARHRLVLTGTPLENSVLDLWSIFDFLMPGYLGGAEDFRERYEVPIAREKDATAQDRLARRVRPFLLRRLKREVAADLPEKIDQTLWCELTEDQAAAYQQMLEASRREVQEAVGVQGEARSRMVVLTALLRLRQICCDLRLLKLDEVDPTKASAKLDLLSELLDEAIDGGHRVLVFSQFVEMLHLVRQQLESSSIDYCYLDGSTSDRAAVVNRFQNDASIPVFLISLKAGGVGLNLTGADTVVHLDPWWNPAVEDQATGRAHRIGQTKTVTSYKLVTRGTVEEKIVQLQARKREIIEGMIGDEQTLSQVLSWNEIEDLLRSS